MLSLKYSISLGGICVWVGFYLIEGFSYLDGIPVGETSGLDVPVARGPVPREFHRQEGVLGPLGPICL